MQVFKAKIGWAIFVPVMAVMLGSAIPMVYIAFTETDSAAIIKGLSTALLLPLVAAGCAHIFLNTRYVIDGDTLIVRSGFWYKKTVAIASIRKVMATRTPVSAPAPSLDRLEIFYHKFDSVIVSPKDKAGFVRELVEINPGIEIA